MKIQDKIIESVAMREEREKRIREMTELRRTLQQPILRELESVGVSAKSLWHLGSKEDPHKRSVPVLVKHIQIFYHDQINETLARALGRLKAVECWNMLVELFCKTDRLVHPNFKDGLACALFDLVSKKTMDEYISLLKDKQHRESRVLMVGKLRRSRQPEIIALIDELAEDEDLKIEIGSWKRFKGKSRQKQL
ncbi:MAG: hypothetical protein H3C47_12855 [Candidatus Cloacimonetes bacterium]|nr:hypothetical protein [Candidatus Cloacimonadota bacterium]